MDFCYGYMEIDFSFGYSLIFFCLDFVVESSIWWDWISIDEFFNLLLWEIGEMNCWGKKKKTNEQVECFAELDNLVVGIFL